MGFSILLVIKSKCRNRLVTEDDLLLQRLPQEFLNKQTELFSIILFQLFATFNSNIAELIKNKVKL